jgi:hypothetical protein
MPYAKITRKEAREWKRRAETAEGKLNTLVSDYPRGVRVDTVEVRNAEWHIMRTARKLGRAIVVVPSVLDKLEVYAVLP